MTNAHGSSKDQTGHASAAVIVCSDRAHDRTYEDLSGPAAVAWLSKHDWQTSGPTVLPDDEEALAVEVFNQVSQGHNLVVVSGGTGLGPRDVTPQVLTRLCDYEVPGFGELLRAESLKYSLNAYLSRCGAWVKGRTLILALPGNPKAVTEQLDILAGLLPHALSALQGKCKDRRSPGKHD